MNSDMRTPRAMRTRGRMKAMHTSCRDIAHGRRVRRVTLVCVRPIKRRERSTSELVAGTEQLEERARDPLARGMRLLLRRRSLGALLVERGDGLVELLRRAVEPL